MTPGSAGIFAINTIGCTYLIANNSRLLILPEYHYPNRASRVLALCERRLAADWPERGGYPLRLLETFVDPRYCHGTLYRAANWRYVGDTRGYRRTGAGYSLQPDAAKRVFVRPCTPKPKPAWRVPYSTPSTAMEPQTSG